MIDISKATAIQGWMTETELQWLAEQAETKSVIVEIGSFLGRSTRALADNTEGIVYALDDWYGPRDVEMEASERDKLFDGFLYNTSGCHNLAINKTDHKNPALAIPDPDMVFIDGSHEYEDVKFDIEYWYKKLLPGGLLSGHDVHFSGVAIAVPELVPDFKKVPETSIWYSYKTIPR